MTTKHSVPLKRRRPMKPPESPPEPPEAPKPPEPPEAPVPPDAIKDQRQPHQRRKTTPRPKCLSPHAFRRTDQPVLRFSLAAWLKLQLLCHAGDTEIGAFAITAPQDPLYVMQLVTIRQTCSSVSVEFDDEAVADFFDEQVDLGRTPDQFFRIWAHTHPGDSPHPSGTDEETFQRVFGACDWAVMFILARGGSTYCRLRVNSRQDRHGSPGEHESGRPLVSISTSIPCEVDYASIVSSDLKVPLELPLAEWVGEYGRNVSKEVNQWPWADQLLGHDEVLFDEQMQDQCDLIDELMDLDDETLRLLMESLDEHNAWRDEMSGVADAQ